MTWSGLELIVVSLNLHLTHNIQLDNLIKMPDSSNWKPFLRDSPVAWLRVFQKSLKSEALAAESFLPSCLTQVLDL